MSTIRTRSVYAEHYVKNSYRARRTPRVDRPMRPRVIAWAGPAAFYQTGWFQRDKWYKARIQYPELLPKMHLIEPTDYYKSLAERLTDQNKTLDINIGFKKPAIQEEKSLKKDPNLEKISRNNELTIDLNQVGDDSLSIALHFNIFSDLFTDGVYFHNVQDFKVVYPFGSVQTGNVVDSSSALSQPKISIKSTGKVGFNTLLMVNIDGDCFEKNDEQREVVHWIVGNIPDGESVVKGEELVPYLQPTPYHGTGYHRVAYILFRHKDKVDFGELKLKTNDFVERLFSTRAFLKQYESALTPSCLKFSQMEWTESVDKTLESQGIKSPRFWYDWNEPSKPQQREFPIKSVPFDRYLDMYRPPEVVDRQVRREWLEKKVHEDKVEKSQYPDLFYADNKKTLPHWQHRQLIDKNLGKGIWSRLYSEHQNPAFQKSISEA